MLRLKEDVLAVKVAAQLKVPYIIEQEITLNF